MKVCFSAGCDGSPAPTNLPVSLGIQRRGAIPPRQSSNLSAAHQDHVWAFYSDFQADKYMRYETNAGGWSRAVVVVYPGEAHDLPGFCALFGSRVAVDETSARGRRGGSSARHMRGEVKGPVSMWAMRVSGSLKTTASRALPSCEKSLPRGARRRHRPAGDLAVFPSCGLEVCNPPRRRRAGRPALHSCPGRPC